MSPPSPLLASSPIPQTRKYPTVQTNNTFYSTSRANPQYTSSPNESSSLLSFSPPALPYAPSQPLANGNGNSNSHGNGTNGHSKTNSVQFEDSTITLTQHDDASEPHSPISPQSPTQSPRSRTRAYSVDLATLQLTRRVGTATPFHIFSFILKLCTGAGLLGLPHAFDNAGIAVSIMLTCTLTAFAITSCMILLRCREIMLVTKQHFIQSESLYDRKSYSTLPRTNSDASIAVHQDQSAHDSFGELAQFAMGHTGTALVDGSLIVSFLGAVAIYLITITQLCSEVYPNIPGWYFTAACTVFLLPFALTRELSWLNKVTVLATFAYISAFIVIFWFGFDLLNQQRHDTKLEQSILSHTSHISYLYGTLSGAMTAFGILTFSLDTPTMVFMFEEEMEKPEKFKPTLIISMITVCAALIVIGSLGVLLFHNTELGVQSIIISNLPSSGWITGSVKLSVAITLLLSAPLSLSPALNLLEHVLTGQHTDACHEPATSDQQADYDTHQHHAHSHNSTPWYYTATTINITRIAVHFLVVFIAFTVPNFTFIISILGCVTFALLCYILPPLFYIILHRRDCTQLHRHYLRINDSKYTDKSDWSLRTYYLFNWTYLLIGTACSAVATFVVLSSPSDASA